MHTFESFKAYLQEKAKEFSACGSESRRVDSANNWEELLQVVKDNADWCYARKICTAETMLEVPDEVLMENHIYVQKTGIVQRDGVALYYSSTSKHYDSSTSKHYDSSTSEHYDSSTSKHYGSSTSEHYDSSTSKHYDSSTSEHYGSSTYGSVYSLHDQSVIHDQAIVRERSTGKVFCKKDAFTIVQIG